MKTLGLRGCTMTLLMMVSTCTVFAQTLSTVGKAIFKQAAPSVVTIQAQDVKGNAVSGTGFIVAADGKIFTNYHVIRNTKRATVRLANGDAFDTVEVLDVDVRKDIALLKIKAIDLVPLKIGSSGAVEVGDAVWSLSNPLGVLENTFSSGHISGIRQDDGYRLLQTTAAISHGSSGGPLFNEKGEVIGITTATFEAGQSLNFAIPIDYARGMLLSPGVPRPLEAFHSPEASSAPAAAKDSAAPRPVEPRPAGQSLPADLRQNAALFLASRLGTWTDSDARRVLGEPVKQRTMNNGGTIVGRISSYADPSDERLYNYIELAFSPKAGVLGYIYFYPKAMTWSDCKAIWGDNTKVIKQADGTRRHEYKNVNLDVLLDKNGVVIYFGLY